METETNRNKAYRLFGQHQDILTLKRLFQEWQCGDITFPAYICVYDENSGMYVPNTEATSAIKHLAKGIMLELDRNRIFTERKIGKLIK